MMVLTRVTIGLIAALVILSTLLARIQDVVRLDAEVLMSTEVKDETGPVLDDQPNHLMWFMQISDIHLSIFQDLKRGTDFKMFCSETVDAIRPAVVLATGDLTDARTPDHLGSRQYKEEWKIYQQILYETGVAAKTHYLDIRGNHDNFNVISLDSSNNYYRDYSVRGKENPRSYIFRLQHGEDSYAFVAMDACMDPGPKRPFNFLGVITENEYETLKKLADMSKNATMAIWFGHYPTSTIAAPKIELRKVMTGPYLCGHLHTLGGTIQEMYSLQTTGYLELELGDWKDNRRFRVAAVDHGIFSFADVYLNQWPVILVTNPKHALFTMPLHEPLHRIAKSTHIRTLVFSVNPIEIVKMRIDGGEWRNASKSEGSLYVMSWNPSHYSEGLHELEVYAQDSSGNQRTIIQPFSLDGTRPAFPVGAQLVLRGHISFAQTMFGVILVITVMPLCILRCIHAVGKARIIRGQAEANCIRRCIFKLYLLATVDRLFWPLIIATLYVAVGPWFIGEIIDGHFGLCFVWGLIVYGSFLPGGLTFVVGTVFLLTIFFPMTLCLSNCVYRRYKILCLEDYPRCTFLEYLCRHTGLIILLVWQLVWAVIFYLSYGLFAFLMGILNTWSIVLFLALWRIAATLPEHCFPILIKPRVSAEDNWSMSGMLPPSSASSRNQQVSEPSDTKPGDS